jgi:hypothetical protein
MKTHKIFIIIVISFLSLALPVYAGMTEGLVSYWAFEEGQGNIAYDSAGSNNGTIYGSTAWVAGQVGDYALYFDDQKYDYVQGANSPFDFANTTFTACGWFKTTSNLYIVSEGSYLHGGWSLFCDSGGKARFQLKEGSPNAYDAYDAWSYSGGNNDGNWHHIAAIVTTSTTNANGNKAEVYVDGLPVTISELKAFPYSPSTDKWCMGNLYVITGHPSVNYQGSVDDIRIYNRALSGEEIYRLYTIPEPATLLLIGTGFLYLIRKRCK